MDLKHFTESQALSCIACGARGNKSTFNHLLLSNFNLAAEPRENTSFRYLRRKVAKYFILAARSLYVIKYSLHRQWSAARLNWNICIYVASRRLVSAGGPRSCCEPAAALVNARCRRLRKASLLVKPACFLTKRLTVFDVLKPEKHPWLAFGPWLYILTETSTTGKWGTCCKRTTFRMAKVGVLFALDVQWIWESLQTFVFSCIFQFVGTSSKWDFRHWGRWFRKSSATRQKSTWQKLFVEQWEADSSEWMMFVMGFI